MNNVVSILSYAKSLIQEPENWLQDTFARSVNSIQVHPKDKEAVRFCASGALTRAFSILGTDIVDEEKAVEILLSILAKHRLNLIYGNICDFNDRTTHDKVLWLYDKAIEQAKINYIL